MTHGKFRLLILALVIVTLPLVWLFTARFRVADSRKPSSLGTFELAGVTVSGQPFEDGAEVRHVLDRFIPRAGLRILGFKLKRTARYKADQRDAPLTVWIRYQGTALRPGPTPPLFGSLVVVKDTAGREFANAIPPSIRRVATNEMLITVPLLKFPTNENHFVLQFSPPPQGPEINGREWVEFRVNNPLYGRALTWSLSPLPQTNRAGGRDVILREVTLQPATIDLEVSCTNCAVAGTLSDSTGRALNRTRSESRITAQSTLYSFGFESSIETNRVWHLDVELSDRGGAPTNSYRLLELSNEDPVQAVTNQFGEVFQCKFRGNALVVTSTKNSGAAAGWTVMGVTNVESGKRVAIRGMSGFPEANSQAWPLQPAASHVIVQLAFPEVVRTEFELRPKDARVSEMK